MQQILFKFWVLAHLHAYFVLHNSTEKKRGAEFVFYHLFTTYTLIWSTRLFGTLEYFFKAYLKVKNPKVGSFLRAPEDLEGLRSQKKLIFQNAQVKM